MPKITNRRLVSSTGADFYPTPRWGTVALLENETFEGSILEPACGDGSMSKVLEEYYPNRVDSSDLNDYGHGKKGVDFLKSAQQYDNIITNPPFNLAEDFVQTGLKLTNKKLALLLRLAFVESVSRYTSIYSVSPPTSVWIFTQRLSMYPANSVVKGSGTTSYGWFIWDKEDTGTGTKLKWIKPGYKK